jgi:hypothetical protein
LLPLVSFLFRFHFVDFVSFRFVFVDFVSFRFVFVDFVSFRFVFVDFVSFRFVSFRFYFVSHFIGAQYYRPYRHLIKINLLLP